MQNNRPEVGLAIIVYNDKKEILLGKRIKSVGNGTWCVPGGHLEMGEEFEECARREVMEEVGLTLMDISFLTVTNDISGPGQHYVSIYMTALAKPGQVVQNLEPDKHQDWQWVSIDNLPDNLFLSIAQVFSTQEVQEFFIQNMAV